MKPQLIMLASEPYKETKIQHFKVYDILIMLTASQFHILQSPFVGGLTNSPTNAASFEKESLVSRT